MTDAIVALIEGALSFPWGLLALAAVAAVDGFFPVVPSESLVVTTGVFAASGDQSVALVIAAAALGAFTGDHVSYASDVSLATGSPVRYGREPEGPPPTGGRAASSPSGVAR